MGLFDSFSKKKVKEEQFNFDFGPLEEEPGIPPLPSKVPTAEEFPIPQKASVGNDFPDFSPKKPEVKKPQTPSFDMDIEEDLPPFVKGESPAEMMEELPQDTLEKKPAVPLKKIDAEKINFPSPKPIPQFGTDNKKVETTEDIGIKRIRGVERRNIERMERKEKIPEARPSKFIKVKDYKEVKKELGEMRAVLNDIIESIHQLDKIEDGETNKIREAEKNMRRVDSLTRDIERVFLEPYE